jgi:hypothetical protein
MGPMDRMFKTYRNSGHLKVIDTNRVD